MQIVCGNFPSHHIRVHSICRKGIYQENEVYIKIAENLTLLKKNENQWYKFEPTSIIENENYKLLWDFPIQPDKELIHNKPDIIIIDKSNKTVQIIDIAIPSDYNVVAKRNEKIIKCIDLSIEIKRMWGMKKMIIIPVIIGTTGTVYKGIKELQSWELPYVWCRFN